MARGTQSPEIFWPAILRLVIEVSDSKNPFGGMFADLPGQLAVIPPIAPNHSIDEGVQIFPRSPARFAALLAGPVSRLFDSQGYLLPVLGI